MIRSINLAGYDSVQLDIPEMVQSHLYLSELPIHEKLVFPITQIDSDSYSTSHPYSIMEMDPLSMFLNRADFKRYAARFSNAIYENTLRKRAIGVQLFGNLYNTFLLEKVPIARLNEELYYRTDLLCDLFRAENPNAVLLSPYVLCKEFHRLKKHYLDYLMHNRKQFDCYSFAYDGQLSESDVGCMTTILSETKNFAQKEFWITDFKLASVLRFPISERTLSLPVQFLTPAMAGVRLLNMFENLRSINPDIFLFYTSIGRDKYSGVDDIPVDWPPQGEINDMVHRHYSGFIDTSNQIKMPIINALEMIAAKHVCRSKFAV